MKPKAPYYVELDSIKDVARLACALEKAPLPIFSMQLHGDHMLATQVDLIMGRPVIYYVRTDSSGEFLAYRNNGGLEDVALVNALTNPSYVYAPIIQVEKIPANMMKSGRVGRNSGYLSIKLKDLTSLAKVSVYKMIYEEPPLPLFLFKNGTLVMGAFMSAGDNSDAAFFYYIDIDSVPSLPFLKYSAQRPDKPSFTNSIDEHGYLYMKVIKLKKDHPLVRIDD